MGLLIMSEPIPAAQKVAELRSGSRAVQSYLDRGRRHSTAPSESLQAQLVDAYRRWSIDPFDVPANQEIDDLSAEYRLRESNLPIQLIQNSIDQGVSMLKATFGELSTKEFQSRLQDLMDHYRSEI
jgi:hypothetical protein